MPAYGCQTFETRATFVAASDPPPADSKAPRPLTPKAHYTFKSPWLSLETPKGDVHRLRVKHESSGREGSRVRPAGAPPFDPAADFWTGTAWTNEIELKILSPKE